MIRLHIGIKDVDDKIMGSFISARRVSMQDDFAKGYD
jgi:hypothetical protein